jgi:tRNA (cmo5U34)-methyltransferase
MGETKTDDLTTASAPEERGGWEFDETVAASFDDMLERSIPNYAGMRQMTTDVACWLADRFGKGARILDVGCSRGAALKPIVDRIGVRGRYVGFDVSDPMLEAARETFDGWSEFVSFHKVDLREGLPTDLPPQACVLSVLTLQFVPIEYRMRLLGQIYDNLSPGGGLVLVEKVLGPSPALDLLEVDVYYDLKRGNGYAQEAIDRKRLALEGRLVPLTAAFNEELLRGAGFADVDVVWAWMNFRGWVALKR